MGRPDSERICTSIVERQNLSVRMGTRRFTQLTNAFSKKWGTTSVAVNQSIRMTPAMAAGITDHIWSVREPWRLRKVEYSTGYSLFLCALQLVAVSATFWISTDPVPVLVIRICKGWPN
jgi:hypothetical protein